jgi:DNA polymerase III alpha subunit
MLHYIMRTDIYGQLILSENDLCDLYMRDPSRTLKKAYTESNISLGDILSIEHKPELIEYIDPKLSLEDFDNNNQSNWYMPKEYIELDIAKFVLDQCTSEAELQRAGEELIMFQERNMFVLLQYLKYLVDTMRKHNIVWGVGRGSSVASFVLFLLGVHRINSLYYDLSIDEFIK